MKLTFDAIICLITMPALFTKKLVEILMMMPVSGVDKEHCGNELLYVHILRLKDLSA